MLMFCLRVRVAGEGAEGRGREVPAEAQGDGGFEDRELPRAAVSHQQGTAVSTVKHRHCLQQDSKTDRQTDQKTNTSHRWTWSTYGKGINTRAQPR